jgi:type IV secretion system protein VirB9
VCDVELEPGENIQGAPHIGDSVRWRISPAVSFEAEQRVTHLIIKATSADLDTNLIVPTDRRTYYMRLVSSEDKYVSRVAFDYPDNDARAWRRASQAAKSGAAGTAGTDDLPAVALSRLRFSYTVTASGNARFKPVRVMDDGTRTFITMSDSMTVDEAPVLFVVGADGTEQLVNYRLRGNIFVIDRLADKLALISGTGGSQQRVDIARDTCVRRGWFSSCPNQPAE